MNSEERDEGWEKGREGQKWKRRRENGGKGRKRKRRKVEGEQGRETRENWGERKAGEVNIQAEFHSRQRESVQFQVSPILMFMFIVLEILTALSCNAPVSYPFKMSKHTKALHCLGVKVKHKVLISHQGKGFFLLQIQDIILIAELLLYNLPENLESFWVAQWN